MVAIADGDEITAEGSTGSVASTGAAAEAAAAVLGRFEAGILEGWTWLCM